MRIEKSEIAEKLAKVKAAVPTKTHIMPNQGVLVKGDKVITNNLEIGITAKLSVETDEPFILVPKALDMINSLPDCELEIRPTSTGVTIIADRIKNTLQSLDPKEFAEPAALTGVSETLKISSKKLNDMASSVLYACSNNESNPTTTGVLFKASGGEMSVVALDGCRAAWNKTDIDGEFKFIVPKGTLEKMLRLGITGDIEISYTNKSAVFASEDYTIYTRLLSGEFFNYQKAFPTRENQIVVSRKALSEGISRILICSDSAFKVPAVFTFAGQKMMLSIKTSLADYAEEIEVHGSTDESLRVGFNANYLRDAVKSYDAEHITMSFGTAVQPLVMSDDELLSLLLPVRLSDKNS